MSSEERKGEGEGGGSGVLAEESKALATKVYEDGAALSVREAGSFLGKLTKLVLAIPNAIVDGGQRLVNRVTAKLGSVPPERRVLPPGPVAGPAILHYALLGAGEDVEELRNMFENLLVSAMDTETAPTVHPAFVGILAQLSSDEAWMLKAITDPSNSVPVVEMRYVNRAQTFNTHGVITMWGDDLKIPDPRKAQYLCNLERLGIIDIAFDRVIADSAEADAAYLELERRTREHLQPREGWFVTAQRGAVRFTPLGRQFWHCCVRRV